MDFSYTAYTPWEPNLRCKLRSIMHGGFIDLAQPSSRIIDSVRLSVCFGFQSDNQCSIVLRVPQRMLCLLEVSKV